MVKNINYCYVFLILIIAVVVYLPGLPGGFIYDDYFNFLQNPAINNSELSFSSAWAASLSGSSGPLGRPLAMLSFYLNYHLSGFSPLSYKLVNIVIHALNSVVVFFVVCRLLKLMLNRTYPSNNKFEIERLAFWVTIIWAVHPINLTAVLYVVQRMTSLSTLFTLIGIYFYLDLRETTAPNIKGMISKLGLITALGIAAALCKEIGLLLFLFIFVIECFLFQWRANSLQERRCLIIYYIFVLVLPLLLAGYLLLNGNLTANYSGRTFDLTQRLLTEFRILWFYIFQILLPQANLFGLHHDDFLISKSLFVPMTTFLSIGAFVSIIFITFKCYKKIIWFGFGLVFFLVGHVMESTILPLNLVHEHRNYLPSLGIIIIFVLSLNLLISQAKIIKADIVFLLITILFSVITINRAYDWSDIVLLGERQVQRHPDSVTANYEMGYAYAKVYEKTHNPAFANVAKTALQRAEYLSDSDMQPAIALVHINSMSGEAENQLLINKIATDFEQGKTSVAEIVSLKQLVNCQIESICDLQKTTIQTLFTSLLKNKNLKGRPRDDSLYIYSTYLASMPEGVSEALTIMQDIASRNENTMEYQIKLIEMFLANGKNNEATLLMDKLTRSRGLKWNVIESNKR